MVLFFFLARGGEREEKLTTLPTYFYAGEDKGALEDLEQSLDNSDFYNATSTKEYCVSIIEKPAEKALASAFGLIAICTNDSMGKRT